MELEKGQIVIGTAKWWDTETQKMEVQICNTDAVGYVDLTNLTIYENLLTNSYFPKAASFILKHEFEYKVIDVSEGTVSLSRRALAEDLFKFSPKGTIRNGFVTGIANNQIFADVEGANGLCVLDEIAYCCIPDVNWILKKGDYLSFYILNFKDNRLLLSRKRAFGTFEEVLDSYRVGGIYSAKVTSDIKKFSIRPGFYSYVIIVDNIVKGIIDVPESTELKIGDNIKIVISAVLERGLSGEFLEKC